VQAVQLYVGDVICEMQRMTKWITRWHGWLSNKKNRPTFNELHFVNLTLKEHDDDDDDDGDDD